MTPEVARTILDEGLSPTWMAASGLVRQDPLPQDSHEVASELLNIETVWNDNGVLNLAFLIATAARSIPDLAKDDVLRARVFKTITGLQRAGWPGLFNRNVNDSGRYEAHDNYAAIAYLCAFFGFKGILAAILAHGRARHWNFNNVEPTVWELRTQRQPGEVALYKVASEEPLEGTWGIVQGIWLAAGLTLNAVSDMDKGHAQLAWLRIETVTLFIESRPFWQRALFDAVFFYWGFRARVKFGTIKGMFYFRPDHPICRLAEGDFT